MVTFVFVCPDVLVGIDVVRGRLTIAGVADSYFGPSASGSLFGISSRDDVLTSFHLYVDCRCVFSLCGRLTIAGAADGFWAFCECFLWEGRALVMRGYISLLPGCGCGFNMLKLPNCCSWAAELLQQMLPSVGLLRGR